MGIFSECCYKITKYAVLIQGWGWSQTEVMLVESSGEKWDGTGRGARAVVVEIYCLTCVALLLTLVVAVVDTAAD